MGSLYGGPGRSLSHDRLAPPHGGYLVGWSGQSAVAGGGYSHHREGVAEIRRMYVPPDQRGQGVARQLLAAVEEAARRAGYRRVILDTGPLQPHAEALYRSAGYQDIERYSGPTSKASYWGGKDLAG